MATLKDDDSGWKASGLKKKVADWEHDPKPPAIKSKKKDTKKWCKGKVGVKHDVQNVLIVTLTDKCVANMRDWRVSCGHWRHYEEKCVNCGKSSYHVAKEQRPKNQQQIQLEEKWCKEGHLYDWVETNGGWWYGGQAEIKTCLMCGKTTGKKRKKITNEGE